MEGGHPILAYHEVPFVQAIFVSDVDHLFVSVLPLRSI